MTLTHATDHTDLPTGSQYGYHVVRVEDVAGVLADGINPRNARGKWDDLNDFLDAIANRLGVEKPTCRGDCSFLYPTRTRGTDPTRHLSGYVTLVVDIAILDSDVYTASYAAASEVTHNLDTEATVQSVIELADDGQEPASSAVEAARDYWESVHPYDIDGCDSADSTTGARELVVDGAVPAGAFTHVFGNLPADCDGLLGTEVSDATAD